MTQAPTTPNFGLPLDVSGHVRLQQAVEKGFETLDSLASKSDPTGVTGATKVSNIVKMSQAAYDALVTKDSATLYVIVG